MNDKVPIYMEILLITDNEDIEEIVRDSLRGLDAALTLFPEAAIFAGAELRHKYTASSAIKELDPERTGHLDPVLVILDANMREDNSTLRSGDGAAAIKMLDWLKNTRPEMPVLVAGVDAGDEIQRKVLSRATVSLWSVEQDASADAESGALFAEALAGLALAPQKPKRRIIIDVGPTSAKYRVCNGRYEFVRSSELAYNDPPTIETMMDKFDKYTPYYQGIPSPNWKGELQPWGKFLFNIMIKDTVGPHLVDMLQTRPGGKTEDQQEVELRFEICIDSPHFEQLFKLPFELVNDFKPNGYLCLRVPMARRIRLKSESTDKGGEPRSRGGQEERPLRILFVKGNVSGDVELSIQDGAASNTFPFPRLKSADEELRILRECVENECSRAVDMPTVIGDEKPPLVGAALRKALEGHLVNGHFDIFHFAGHSISFGPNKGTYLIFPGEHGTADAVPIEHIVDWLSRGGCHLIVLSSCEGASVLTAMEAMRCGAEGIIGFRWIVDDQLCANYFKRFYQSYLKEGHSYSVSFRDACNEVSLDINKLPTWASAVAVLRD